MRPHLFLMVLLTAAVTSCFDHQPWSKTPKSIDQISKDSTLHFPPNSTIAEWAEDKGAMFDRAWAAKVILPKEAVETFLKEVALKKTDTIGIQNAQSSHLAWWKPQRIVAKSRFRGGDATLLDLLICEEDGKTVVYIQFYTI